MFKHIKDNQEDSSTSSNSNRSSRSGDSEPADGETLCSESESDDDDCDTSLSGFTFLTIILVQCITVVFTTGFIVRSGDEEEIGDNDGDDEVDDLGIGRKRKRLVRNKLAGNNLLI